LDLKKIIYRREEQSWDLGDGFDVKEEIDIKLINQRLNRRAKSSIWAGVSSIH